MNCSGNRGLLARIAETKKAPDASAVHVFAAVATLGVQVLTLQQFTELAANLVAWASTDDCAEPTLGRTLVGFVSEASRESSAFLAALGGLWLVAVVAAWPAFRRATTPNTAHRTWCVLVATSLTALAIALVANLITMNHAAITMERWHTILTTPLPDVGDSWSACSHATALPAIGLVLLTLARRRADARWASTALIAAPAFVLPTCLTRLELHQLNCHIHLGQFDDMLPPLSGVLFLAPVALYIAVHRLLRAGRSG